MSGGNLGSIHNLHMQRELFHPVGFILLLPNWLGQLGFKL